MGGSDSSLIDTPTSITGANAHFRKIMPRPYIDAWYARWTRRQFSPRSHLYKSRSLLENHSVPRPTTAQASGTPPTSIHAPHHIGPRRLPVASRERSPAIPRTTRQTRTTSSLSGSASDEDATDNILGTPPSSGPRAILVHSSYTDHPVIEQNHEETDVTFHRNVYANKVVTAPQKVQGPGEAAVGSPTHLSIPGMPSKSGCPTGTSKTIDVRAIGAIPAASLIQQQAPRTQGVESFSLKSIGKNQTLRVRASRPAGSGAPSKQANAQIHSRTLPSFAVPTGSGSIPDVFAVGGDTIRTLAKQKGRQTEDNGPESPGGMTGPSRVSVSPGHQTPKRKDREVEGMSRKRRCLGCRDRHDKVSPTGAFSCVWVQAHGTSV